MDYFYLIDVRAERNVAFLASGSSLFEMMRQAANYFYYLHTMNWDRVSVGTQYLSSGGCGIITCCFTHRSIV